MAERITLTIETENAAFDDEPANEVARILRAVARDFALQGGRPLPIRDRNGNTCGTLKIERM